MGRVTLVSDDFNRADEDPIAAPWVPLSSSQRLLGNALTGKESVPFLAYHDARPFPPDQWAQATTYDYGNDPNWDTGVSVRGNTGSNWGYHCYGYESGARWDIAAGPGVWGEFASTSFNPPSIPQVANGQVLRAEAVGDTIRLYVDGTLVVTLTGAVITAGQPGSASYGGPDRGGIDDWSAGTWEGVQTRYRVYTDEASPVAIAAENAQAIVSLDTNFLVRVQLDCDGDVLNSRPYQIEYSDNAGSTWSKCLSGSGKVRLSASSHIASSGADTTSAVLTSPGTTFTAGRLSDDTNPLPTLSLTASQYTEFVWCLQVPTGQAVGNDEFLLRVTDAVAGDAISLYEYTEVASVKIASGLPVAQYRRTRAYVSSLYQPRPPRVWDGATWRPRKTKSFA